MDKKVRVWKDAKIASLQIGDTVRHKSGGPSYLIAVTFGNRATAIRTADLTNECEWEVFK